MSHPDNPSPGLLGLTVILIFCGACYFFVGAGMRWTAFSEDAIEDRLWACYGDALKASGISHIGSEDWVTNSDDLTVSFVVEGEERKVHVNNTNRYGYSSSSYRYDRLWMDVGENALEYRIFTDWFADKTYQVFDEHFLTAESVIKNSLQEVAKAKKTLIRWGQIKNDESVPGPACAKPDVAKTSSDDSEAVKGHFYHYYGQTSQESPAMYAR